MADVSRWQRGGGRGRDRGQILLVAGLAVAVTLVALVLLLNTVIYSQNLAARGSAVEDDQAVAFQREAAVGVGEIVVAENREEYDDWEGIDESVRDAVARYDDLHSRYPAERATIADVEEDTLALSEGTLIRQTNETRNFTSVDETADWTVADGVESAREFEMTVSRENLSESRSDAFRIRLVGDDGIWEVYVYDGDDAVAVAVDDGTGSTDLACAVPGPEATIDLTAGTVDGSACPGLVYAEGVAAPYDVEFENGDEVTGSYGVTVDEPPTGLDVTNANFADADSGASPRALPAVYAAEFDVHFETPTLEYHTTVRVAPGEPE